MKIAIIGDRGIPARYSGYSTLVEEMAVRLQELHGIDVSVYCRKPYFETHPSRYRGVRLEWLPSPGGKSFESIIHSNISVLHASLRGRFGLVFIVDPGNGPFCLPLKARGVPVVYHTDGLGWKRTKWNRLQRAYYKWSEGVTSALADWLVTDSLEMVRYYKESYGRHCTFIPYGSIVGDPPSAGVLQQYGLTAGEYYLVAARMEPENNTALIIDEYKKSSSPHPLVVVGGVPYRSRYAQQIADETDPRIRVIGSVYDAADFNGLVKHCRVYLHGHEVGGTNPSLLRAMGAGVPCLPLGVGFNREVVGWDQPYFTRDPGHLAGLIEQLEDMPGQLATMREATLERSRTHYRWDAVACAYADLFRKLVELRKSGMPLTERTVGETYAPLAMTGPHEDWPREKQAL